MLAKSKTQISANYPSTNYRFWSFRKVPSGASAGAVRACGVKLGPAQGCRVAGWTRRLPTIPEERPEGEDAKAAEAAKAAVAGGAAARGGAALAEELGDFIRPRHFYSTSFWLILDELCNYQPTQLIHVCNDN